MFIVLYPLGILLGEMPLYVAGLPFLRERRLHSLALPNALNFSFDYYRVCQARPAAPQHAVVGWEGSACLCSLVLPHVNHGRLQLPSLVLCGKSGALD